MSDVLRQVPEVKPRTFTRRFLEKFGDDLFVWVQKKFERMPQERAEMWGTRLGAFHHAIDSKHRKRTESNLKMVFPDWTEEKIKATGKAVHKHFGLIAGDFLRSPIRSDQEVLDSVVEVEGMEYLEEAEAQGRGILMITAHYGNWERFLQWMTAKGRPLNVIARDANQDGVNQRILDMRESKGAKVMSRGNSAIAALRCLKAKKIVGILADQNSKDAVVPLFGIPAGTVTGPALFHVRTKAPLLPAYCIWLSPGKYKIMFLPLVDPKGLEEDYVAIMTELNKSLEVAVRAHPEQWLWMHDRWKLTRRHGLIPGVPPTR